MNRPAAALLLAALLVPVPAAAQAAPPSSEAKPSAGAQKGGDAGAKPSKVALDLARALTPPATWDGILDAYATSLAGQISAALGAHGKEPSGDMRQKIRADLAETVKYEGAIEMQARALAQRFNADELATLERFYRGGPGRKLLDALPEVSREVNEDLRTRLSARVPEIVKKYAPSLAEAAPAPGASGGAAKSDGTASSGAASGGAWSEQKGGASGGTAGKAEAKKEEAPRK